MTDTNGASVAISLMIAYFAGLFAIAGWELAYKSRKLTDRYRLKFGWNDEIERKESSGDSQFERRKRAYKKRTFQD